MTGGDVSHDNCSSGERVQAAAGVEDRAAGWGSRAPPPLASQLLLSAMRRRSGGWREGCEGREAGRLGSWAYFTLQHMETVWLTRMRPEGGRDRVGRAL